MATRASAQCSVLDVTDGYSVILTSDAHTFPGTTTAAKASSTTTRVIAMCGSNQVAARVVASEITKPNGVTVSVDTDPMTPTLTVNVTASVTSGGTVKIPVHIDDNVIHKEFTFAIAFSGSNGSSVGVSSTSVTYQESDSGTTAPTGSWGTSVPSVAAGKYLWTKTVVTYSDGKSTTAYSVSRSGTNGSDGDSVTVSSTAVTYQESASGTSAPTGNWSSSVPSVPAGHFLWTKTVVTYSDGKAVTSYSVGRNGTNGTNGADGADAITLVITSSNGFIFKNTAIATTMTAHVYKGGAEVTGSALTALGTIKWYKDGASTPVATGQTLTVDAGDVYGKADYIAKLED